MAKNWAISIGINKYDFLQPLNYAQRDAQLMQEFLCNEAGFNRVLFFSDDSPDKRPSRTNLLRVLRQLGQDAKMAAGDNFWFFFSGHGMRHTGRDYLMPLDGDANDIENTAISISYITDNLRLCGADNVVLILDACRNQGTRSGEGIGNQTAEVARQIGVISIFSCSPNEYSYEIETLQQGAFTHALLEGLGVQGQCATVERLNQYLLHRVPEINRQYGKGRQTPYTIAEPVTKSHLILLPRFATLADISILKNDAYRAAQIDEDLELAEQLWIRVLAAASGQDMDAVRALQKIAQLRVGSSEVASPSNPANQNVGDKSPNFQAFAEPTCIQFNIKPNSSRDGLSSVQELDYLSQEQLVATDQGREVNEESFSQTQSANPPLISQAIDSSVAPSPNQVLAGFFGLVFIGIICVLIVTSSHWVLTGFFSLIITGILASIALPSFFNQAAKAKQSEAKTYIGCINRAQQAFYLEQSQFASRVEELAIGIRAETQYYIYKICVVDKTKTLATATAKEDGLKSYAGAVFVIKDGEGYDTTIAALCETAQASRTPPEMPQLVGSHIECAPDSFNPSKL